MTTYRVHQFTTVGASSFNVIAASANATVECLVVAGGGGGKFSGGGGGEVKYEQEANLSVSSISVVVGPGGVYDADGGDSQFGSIVSTGGYKESSTYVGGTSGSGQFFGGAGKTSTYVKGGGGAGAGANGNNAGNSDNPASGGQGGTGVYHGDIFGEQYGEDGWFGGGGGGYGYKGNNFVSGSYLGGLGGGGDGYIGFAGTPRARGMANTGGGGPGGEPGNESVGGSGTVIIRYPKGTIDGPEGTIQATGGNLDYIFDGISIYKIHRFTEEGTHTFTVTDTGRFNQKLRFVTDPNSTFDDVSSATGVLTSASQSYTVVVGSGGSVAVAYPLSSLQNNIPFSKLGVQ